MTLPEPVARLWEDLEAARAEVLREAEAVSQRQADWKPGDRDWSIGEIVHHLTVAEVATGKLTTKLFKEYPAGAPQAFPADLTSFAPLPGPSGPGEAPQAVWPEHGRPIAGLLADMRAARARSRQSVERLATCDPRTLRFRHFRLGDLDLAQWWTLQADHDRTHLAQMRDVKARAGFPAA